MLVHGVVLGPLHVRVVLAGGRGHVGILLLVLVRQVGQGLRLVVGQGLVVAAVRVHRDLLVVVLVAEHLDDVLAHLAGLVVLREIRQFVVYTSNTQPKDTHQQLVDGLVVGKVVGETTHHEENQGQFNLLILCITKTHQSHVFLFEVLRGGNT